MFPVSLGHFPFRFGTKSATRGRRSRDPRARVADKLGGKNKKQGVRFVFVLIVNVIYRTLLEGVWLIEFGR